jgi:hypothetical protein
MGNLFYRLFLIFISVKSCGGVFYKNELGIDYVDIPMSAHHLDLHSPNPEDPIYLVEGRNLER